MTITEKLADLCNININPCSSTSSHRACGCITRGIPGASFCALVATARIAASYSANRSSTASWCRIRARARLHAPVKASVAPMPDKGDAQYLSSAPVIASCRADFPGWPSYPASPGEDHAAGAPGVHLDLHQRVVVKVLGVGHAAHEKQSRVRVVHDGHEDGATLAEVVGSEHDGPAARGVKPFAPLCVVHLPWDAEKGTVHAEAVYCFLLLLDAPDESSRLALGAVYADDDVTSCTPSSPVVAARTAASKPSLRGHQCSGRMVEARTPTPGL
ncbi:hypothetical protein CCM_08007 [Cordyceps militaris CM01]|uniref:Uncharacterized protein n=1 Tax=Cordyceps militaris (strain CM01) TaxID=983644 RepID=G3JPE4_CORMM|nr:uncharacterized protein CCM_08007 [Cordyceps militaris CM01]EGX89754.1 hypothetical protein CCM_08007 [Cordyceps militaris CM01]